MDAPSSNNITPTQAVAYIAGFGMVTPLGGNSTMTTAAVNAGLSSYQASGFYNENNQPVTMSLVPPQFFSEIQMEIDEGRLYGEQDEHVIKMAVCAIREALGSLVLKGSIPLILAFPESPTDIQHSFTDNLITNLVAQQDLPIAKEMIRTLHTGRAAGLEAIALGMRYLYDQQHDYVLVGASDSYFHCSRLNDLSIHDRLLAPQNMDGFAPGEAAGFLLLTRNRSLARIHQQRVVAILEPGMGEEKGHILNDDKPHRGDGLDTAVKQALSKHDNIVISDIYSSMNGERYWSKEHGVAMIRNEHAMSEEVEVHHPADCYGDLGAATGPVLTALAASHLWNKGGQNDQALVYCASEGPDRAALCLRKM